MDNAFAARTEAARYGLPLVQAAVAVPVLQQGATTVGHLMLASRTPGYRFTALEESLATTLAEHAGLAIQDAETVDALHAALNDAQHRASHDALTGLANRATFMAALERALESEGEHAAEDEGEDEGEPADADPDDPDGQGPGLRALHRPGLLQARSTTPTGTWSGTSCSWSPPRGCGTGCARATWWPAGRRRVRGAAGLIKTFSNRIFIKHSMSWITYTFCFWCGN